MNLRALRAALSICLVIICIPPMFPQKLEMFNYTSHGDYDLAVPKFDLMKPEGTQGIAVWKEDTYIHKLFNSVVKSVLPKKKRDMLHLNTAVLLAFTRRGEVINCKFLLNTDDRNILTEEELYKIYIKLKRIRINPYKVRIDPDPVAGGTSPDYAIISGPLISRTGRERIMLNSDKK
ncbi:MAG TPA: hypothetical protein VMT63_07560 [Bacteroidales bacterium]|nr:hypothetical protein [Bacteroidales bacterium]